MKQKKLGYVAEPQIGFTEQFKGTVFDKPVRFPTELGAEHPFNFEDTEKVYCKIGLVSGAVNKITDAVVGDFVVKVEDENAQALIDDFVYNSGFTVALREWVREAVLKGNGFMELDLDNTLIRVMNANHMYVRRKKNGEIIEYNQFTGNLNRFSKDSKQFITFKPDQIAHLSINKIPNDPYGIGFVWPNERVIENLVRNEQDLHKLISRKAGAPIHGKLGVPGEQVSSESVDDLASKMKYMNNRTEWATDANVEFKVIDFGNLGQSLTETVNHDVEMLASGMEVPVVLLGKANIPEGLAKVQMETFQRKIQAIQKQTELLISNKIFGPLLRANGLDFKVKFVWNLPGEEEKNKRIEKLTALLGSMSMTTPESKAAYEIELARILELDELIDVLRSPQEAQEQAEKEKEEQKKMMQQEVDSKMPENKERKQEETKVKQPEVPGAKPNAKSCGHLHLTEQASGDMTIKEFVSLQEMAGFNYSDFLISILRRVKIDKFENLAAMSDADLLNGKLNETEIKKLRIIMREGFRKNQTIREIEDNLKESIDFKDAKNGDKVIVEATRRPNMISRTETVRLANAGLVDLFKENKIEKVRFLAALSDRTCPICEELNGQVFEIGKLNVGENQPPIHPDCRCTLLSILE